ncbi:MAG: hypothetical protein ACI9QD_000121, partial [Thermoproteota archaeon]
MGRYENIFNFNNKYTWSCNDAICICSDRDSV